MEKHPGLDVYSCGAVKAALCDIVGVQFRNGATLGGSLWRRMGFSDVVALFLAMDSSVELFNGGVVPLEEFVRMPYDNDILVRLIVKKRPGAFAYQAVRKQRTDLPTLNCAAAKVGEEYRVVVGSRPARAMLLRDERGILAGGITEESAAAFGRLRGGCRSCFREHVGLGGVSPRAGTRACASHPAGIGGGAVMEVTIKLNGRTVSDDVSADMLLIDFVRAHGCLSVKRGCETSACGLCTVLLDGEPVLSCSTLVARADGHSVHTLEGLQDEASEFVGFIADQGAEQCGFCNPGFVMNTIALLRENPDPTDDEILSYLSGNLCRCSGYVGQLRGIRNFLTSRNVEGGSRE